MMQPTPPTPPREQQKLETLLVRLEQIKPVAAKPLQTIPATRTAHPQVFYST